MAKLGFTKLGLKVNQDIQTITYNDCNIEVKMYLPIINKLETLSEIINSSIEDVGYYNEGKLRTFFVVNIIRAYTNISFTEKQMEDPCKLYDLLISSGLWDMIWDILPDAEKEQLEQFLYKTIDAIYTYKNSVMGILDVISQDYNNLSLDASEITKSLNNSENFSVLKEVLNKLG